MAKIQTEILIVAAGQGSRMGAKGNKLFLPLAGKPLLHHTLTNLAQSPLVGGLHLVVRPGEESQIEAMLTQFGAIPKLKGMIPGGAERPDSVRNGLRHLLAQQLGGVVMVHDGARPLVHASLIERLFRAAFEGACALPVLPVADTTRQVEGNNSFVVNRANLRLTQTPQAFPLAWVEEVFFSPQAQNQHLTDEGAYFEAAGKPVTLVQGDAFTKKITEPSDLAWAEAMLPLFLAI